MVASQRAAADAAKQAAEAVAHSHQNALACNRSPAAVA